MNSKKMALLTVMVVAVGLFALPNTVLFIEEEWKEVPMTEEEVLSAWEKLPAEWKDILARWEELAPEFGELLSEWETIPEEWKDLLPAWEKLPAEYKECLLKGEKLPLNWEELPPECRELISTWKERSPEFEEFIAKWEKLPPECKELLLKWDELPPECKKLLTNWEDLPEEWKDPLLEQEDLKQTQTPEGPYDETMEEVMAELSVGGAHRNFSCDTCHKSPITDAAGSFDNDVECMDCHGDTGNITGHWNYSEYVNNCSICHWMSGTNISSYNDSISAGGFGMNATLSDDVGSMAGHEDLILWAESSTSMAGANEACVACHTDVNVSFTMPKKEYMGFDAGMGNVTMEN